MRKSLFLIGTAVLIVLAACSAAPKYDKSPYGLEDKLADITMTVKESAVGPEAETVTLEIKNLSNKEYTFGAPFELELEKDGIWYTYPANDELSFIMIAYILEPGGKVEEPVSLYSLFGKLEPGSYRIVKSFGSEDKSGVAFGTFLVQ